MIRSMTRHLSLASYPDAFVQALDSVHEGALQRIEKVHEVRISFQGNVLYSSDRDRNKARALVDQLFDHWDREGEIDFSIIEHGAVSAREILPGIRPKTEGQVQLIEELDRNTVTFAVGPAGTGKTFLAIAHAVKSLKSGAVDRLVLTRPVVESGEKLGFLPGSLEDKIDPYMRPLFDALRLCMPDVSLENLSAKEAAHPQRSSKTRHTGAAGSGEAAKSTPSNIEIAPLAYMRGRTLTRAVVVLDEAQNTTPEQMKMFLTRLGHGSQMIITGDPRQSDLGRRNGLADFLERYEARESKIPGLEVVTLGNADIVRHWMVSELVGLYDGEDSGSPESGA